jgi:hypothetical protein
VHPVPLLGRDCRYELTEQRDEYCSGDGPYVGLDLSRLRKYPIKIDPILCVILRKEFSYGIVLLRSKELASNLLRTHGLLPIRSPAPCYVRVLWSYNSPTLIMSFVSMRTAFVVLPRPPCCRSRVCAFRESNLGAQFDYKLKDQMEYTEEKIL